MACSLTSGRALPCKSAVGGLKAVYFADYGTLGAATITAGEITAFAGTPEWFEFDIKADMLQGCLKLLLLIIAFIDGIGLGLNNLS